MNQPSLTEQHIAGLLKDLQSKDASVRRQRVKSIREQKIADAGIVDMLKILAASDANGSVRKEASKTLKALGITPPPLAPELARKRKDFWLGVGLYFILNLLLGLLNFALVAVFSNATLSDNVSAILGLVVTLLPWVLNIGLIIFLTFKRPQMALGMLAGFGISLLIVIVLGLLFVAVCFVLYSGSGI